MKQSMKAALTRHAGRGPVLAVILLALPNAGCGDEGGSDDPSPPVGGRSFVPGNGGTADPADFQCTDTAEVGATVNVPEGEFMMGCNDEVDDQCKEDERPSRVVFVRGFDIQVTEVTQAQYTTCMADGACSAPSCAWDCGSTNYPASCITRDQAMEYCAYAGMRLPTEAEWEKAARGADGRKYPWGNDEPTCDLVNMAGCVNDLTPAGAYSAGASPYGALDMAGNMVEMLADWYDPSYYATAPNVDPTGPGGGQTYVGRGGGWKSEPPWHRTSVRDWYAPADAGASLGFRCAR